MTDALKKMPWQLIIQVAVWVFLAGMAYATFAPKPWVEEKIKEHEVRTEEVRKQDMRDIKDALNRIEERQYQQAQQQSRRR